MRKLLRYNTPFSSLKIICKYLKSKLVTLTEVYLEGTVWFEKG